MLWARLAIYRGILKDPVIKSLVELLDILAEGKFNLLDAVDCYHRFIFALAGCGRTYRSHLMDLVLHDENAFSRQSEVKEYAAIAPSLIQTVQHDLNLLQQLYHLDFARLDNLTNSSMDNLIRSGSDAGASDGFAPKLIASQVWADQTEDLYRYYHTNASGIMSRYHALRWDDQCKELTGIPYPDQALLSDLVGYQSQKEQICRNTEQFLAGCPANNVLLYGSRGTGKSTMVKALLNEYWPKGLRIVEVACENLESLPEIIDILRSHALKYIIFIDDLSFEDYETRYKGLKAVMEGSLDARPANVLLYATSNRRHLVREYHSDRSELQDDEIHTWDTMQEKLSLSDRFGLTVTFESPNQQLYLSIVEKLVNDRGLNLDEELVRYRAIAWERSHQGPSGRTARQFVDSLGDGKIIADR